MNLCLDNKIMIVTGGAGGIGEGIARVLAAEGAIPVIVGQNADDNKNQQDELEYAGRPAFTIQAQLSEPTACETVISIIREKFGHIEGLVNCAGLVDGVSLDDGNNTRFMKTLCNNLVHYYLMAHFALDDLKKSHGAIVNITSKKITTARDNVSVYAAAHGGRNGLTREWAVELLNYGIRVNSIIVSGISQEHQIANSEKIGNTVAFLLSEKSSHTTGQLIHVDGGYLR